MNFAKINSENIVEQIILADQAFIDSGKVGNKDKWIESSDNGLRKNDAIIGYTYDATKDAFYAPQPYPSWTLDDDTCIWNAPVAYPSDGKMYSWDEDNTEWKELY